MIYFEFFRERIIINKDDYILLFFSPSFNKEWEIEEVIRYGIKYIWLE